MPDALAPRRAERERLLALAADYVERLKRRLPLVAAAVVGSVARGDFNVWSDVDVVVVVEELPQRAPDRAATLVADAPAGVQPIGYTPDEIAAALASANPIALELIDRGVVLSGERFVAKLATSASSGGRAD